MFDVLWKCPKCQNAFMPGVEETISAYGKHFDENPIITPSFTEAQIPDFLIMKCHNRECFYEEKWTVEKALQEMRKAIGELAWHACYANRTKGVQFENYFTRYVQIEGLNTFATQHAIDSDKVLQDYIKAVERKYTEKSDDKKR